MNSKDYKYQVGDLVKHIASGIIHEVLKVERAANGLAYAGFYYLKSDNSEEGYWVREGILYSKYEPVSKAIKVLFSNDQGSEATRSPRQAIQESSVDRGLGSDDVEE